MAAFRREAEAGDQEVTSPSLTLSRRGLKRKTGALSSRPVEQAERSGGRFECSPSSRRRDCGIVTLVERCRESDKGRFDFIVRRLRIDRRGHDSSQRVDKDNYCQSGLFSPPQSWSGPKAGGLT